MTALDNFHNALLTTLMTTARASSVPCPHWSVATVTAVPDSVAITGSATVLVVHVVMSDNGGAEVVDNSVCRRNLDRRSREASSSWHGVSGHRRRRSERILVAVRALKTKTSLQTHSRGIDFGGDGFREGGHCCLLWRNDVLGQ